MKDNERLEHELGRLRREIEPSRDLWPDIEARLARRRRRHPLHWAAAAAVAGLAMTLGLALGPAGGPTSPPAGNGHYAARTQLSPSAPVRRAALTDYALNNSDLDPQTRNVVAQNLKVIHGALDNINAALDKHPGDPRLQALLLAVEQEESALLRRAQKVGTENRYKHVRTDI